MIKSTTIKTINQPAVQNSGIKIFLTGLTIMSLMEGNAVQAAEGVILLHGLCRTARSMEKMASALSSAGYVVLNVDYPSREATVGALSESTVKAALDHEKMRGVQKIHFVTHSLGGILVRQYLKNHRVERLGRVVMLGPPNQGSEVVDKLGDFALFNNIHGPSGRQLGTAEDSIPNHLGPVNFELGVIAGDRSINWINSFFMIKGPDDGKVSIECTKVKGMKEHRVVHVSHPFLMRNNRVIQETIRFLRSGNFSP